MHPTAEWLAQYAQKRALLAPVSDLNTYFDEQVSQIAGQAVARTRFGPVSLPDGRVLVRDPLVYLQEDAAPYFLRVPAGEYATEACVVLPDEGDCARYAAVRIRFGPEAAVSFTEALIGHEDLSSIEAAGDYFGFNVDAGLACVADTVTQAAFCAFARDWYAEHPGQNLYDDYFAALFQQSYLAAPQYQRPGGDWLNWRIPGTDYHLPMFQSGFGDGTYPVYFGFDAQERICQLVVQFIDIELACGEEA